MRQSSILKFLRRTALAALVAASGQLLADVDAIRYYEDAVARFNSGDLKGAEIQLKNSLRRDPGQLAARVLMGRTQLVLGNAMAAEEELLLAIELGADPALTALPLARARNRLGKYAEVERDLMPTQHPPPVQADLWAELGKARLANRDQSGAEMAFAAALDLQPSHVDAVLGQARVALQKQDLTGATTLITRALSDYPDNPESWFLMGSLYHARGELAGAVAHFRQARSLDPRHYGASLGEASALLEDGKPAEAAPLLEQLFSERRTSLKVAFLYGRTLKLLGRTEEAAAIIRHASDLAGVVAPAEITRAPELLYLAAAVTFENGEYERSRAFLEKYVQRNPDDLQTGLLMAKLLLKMNKPVDASRLLIRLLAGAPEDVDVLVLLGDTNIRLHDYAAAERSYRAALAQIDSDPRLLTRVGLAQFRSGRTGLAIGTLEGLIEATDAAGPSLFLAMLYSREKRWDEARDLAERVLQGEPDNPLASHLLGVIAVLQGDLVRGRQLLEGALRRAPDYRAARLDLARLNIREKRHADARQTLLELLQDDPSDVEVLHGLANLALAQGERDQALQQLRRIRQIDRRAQEPVIDLVKLLLAEHKTDEALTIAQGLSLDLPSSLGAKLMLVRAQLASGDRASALATLQLARDLAAEDPDGLFRLALVQAETGELEAARTSLEGALALRPNWNEARVRLAHLSFRQGRLDDAERLVQSVLDQTRPADIQALTLQGDIRMRQGRPAEAASVYQRGLDGADLPELAVRRYRALAAAGEPQQALRGLQDWHDRHPDRPGVMRLLAELRFRNGEHGAARDLYERLVQLSPDDALAHNNLAVVYQASDTERALRAAARAYQLAPEKPTVLDTLGWLLVQVGEMETALRHLREAVARDSRSAVIRYHLGVALAEYGNSEEAIRELNQALRLDLETELAVDARRRLQALR